jgi:hypothetical protein
MLEARKVMLATEDIPVAGWKERLMESYSLVNASEADGISNADLRGNAGGGIESTGRRGSVFEMRIPMSG